LAEKKAIPLRISHKMWEELNRWADEEFRSVNGQIEYILNEAINKRKRNSQQDNINNEESDEKDR
jgi:hypothetical protein